MLTIPKIVERDEQPYVAITAKIPMREIGPSARSLHPEVSRWLNAHGTRSSGAPFFRYVVIDMERLLEIEFGFPTSATVAGDERVQAGVLPAGRYASLTHFGPYDQLYDANGALIRWAADQGIRFDVTETPAGDRFGCRLEIYETDPGEQPDPAKWETEVAIRLID
jgi:effector-binding domain-containing protein